MVAITSLRASALLALASLVSAQTPEGFSPAAINNQTLSVSFGSNNVSPAGELIPRPETASPPTLSTTLAPSANGVLFMIDQDVLRNGTRMTLLHWFVPNVPLSIGTLSPPVPSNSTAGAMYLQPSPPVGDIPHRYVLLLFAQPEGFTVPADFPISPPASTANRIGFNVTAFAEEAGLGNPFAANWFSVQNTTGVASTTSASSSMASATATVAPYTGGALRTEVNYGTSWAAGIGGVFAAMWYIMF